MLQTSDDLSAAAWLTETAASPERLTTFGPAGFPAYARLRYLPDPIGPGMSETDAYAPSDHAPDIDVARTALRALATYSSSTGNCYVCIWDGYGMLRPELTHGSVVALPHRRYMLFTGTLGDLDQWNDLFESECNWAPAFVWPTDHQWCFTSDVDPPWAGIGADTAVINQLLSHPNLNVAAANADERQPTYY